MSGQSKSAPILTAGISSRPSPITDDVLEINGDCVYSDRIPKPIHDADHSVIGTDPSIYQEENTKVLI
ncbi:MAG: hypothetical protein CMB45_03525 [Euryarchaeota archaeon]|nr:hypothetical protein [Euryarchaeota archaeon]